MEPQSEQIVNRPHRASQVGGSCPGRVPAPQVPAGGMRRGYPRRIDETGRGGGDSRPFLNGATLYEFRQPSSLRRKLRTLVEVDLLGHFPVLVGALFRDAGASHRQCRELDQSLEVLKTGIGDILA